MSGATRAMRFPLNRDVHHAIDLVCRIDHVAALEHQVIVLGWQRRRSQQNDEYFALKLSYYLKLL